MTRKKILSLLLALLLLALPTAFAKKKIPAAKPDPVPVVVENPLPQHKHTTSCDKTTAEPVEIICILDRSGSMGKVVSDTIGGYNSFIERQRQESGKARVTTVLFDDKYELLHDAVNLKDVPELTSGQYYARGTTALLDAVGRTLTETAGKMEKEGVCPAKRRVLVLIMTDGLENASREYTKSTVKAMIEKATVDYKWNFIFMGANIDSVSEAASIGINADHAADFSHDGAGVQKTFARMNAAASAMRKSGDVGDSWKN